MQPMLYNTLVLADESKTKLCIFQVSSRDTIKLPYFLGRLILPAVADIVTDHVLSARGLLCYPNRCSFTDYIRFQTVAYYRS